jgi:uncharacterized membrane protein YfcA
MTLIAVGAVALGVFSLAAAAQAVTGFGLALVAVPLLAVFIDPVAAVVATVMVSLVLTGFASYRERDHVERPVAARLTGSALLGMPLGLLVLSRLDERSLKVVVAGGLLFMVVLLVARVRLPAGITAQYGSGLLSGMLLTSTGMNGPPVVLGLQSLGLPPRRFRGTLQAVFCGQDLVAVGAFLVLGHLDPGIAAAVVAGAVGVPVGWWAGDRVFGWLPPERFRTVVLSMLALTAVVSLSAAVT